MSDPSITVVIPALNSATELRRLLASLRNQTSPAEEVVVVDGGSGDATAEAATASGGVLLHDVGRGDRRSHARNLGARAASGEFLIFLDADMEATSGMLAACRSAHAEGALAVTIPEVTAGMGLLGEVRAWERSLVHAQRVLVFPRGIDRQVFLDCGGFDESLSGFEDLDLAATLMERNVRVTTAGASVIHHEESLTVGSYLHKRIQYAKGATTYRQKHPNLAQEVFSPLGRLKMYLSGVHSLRDVPLFAFAVALRSVEYVWLR